MNSSTKRQLSHMDRRLFLAGLGLAGVPMLSGKSLFAQDRNDASSGLGSGNLPGLIMRERSPVNLEYPFPTLSDAITPNNRFFVRCHFPVPKIDKSGWRLKVDGHVEKELTLSFDDLRKLSSREVSATLECAGNSRAFLQPKASGVLWELGGVSNAKWTGVPLSAVLKQAGIRDGAVDVILEGADVGEVKSDPKSPGPIHFVRSLPVEKATRPEVLLAFAMNGETLTPEHGFPVRAVVPGWYGMASVKWLSRITVSPKPYRGFWQTMSYTYWEREDDRPNQIPITEMQVKSEIARPCLYEVIPAGKPYRVFGAAWAGEANVKKIEVSTDGGETWKEGKLLGEAVPFSWRLWEFEWQTPKTPGPHRLMARATDDRGRTQPKEHNLDHGAYMIHHTLPIEVMVG